MAAFCCIYFFLTNGITGAQFQGVAFKRELSFLY